MSLVSLQSVLQGQADAGGRVRMSAATVTAAGSKPRARFDELVRGGLALDGDLVVAIAGRVPDPTGATLALAGTAELLGVPSATVRVTFTEQPDGTVDVLVEVEPGAGWRLGKAFAGLRGDPLDALPMSRTAYAVATAPEGTLEWNGAPRAIRAGAQLFTVVALDGSLAPVVGLLTGATRSDEAVLTGTVDPSRMASPSSGYPKLDLAAELGKPVAVPHFALSAPRIELTTATDVSGRQSYSLALTTTLAVDKDPVCRFKAALLGATTVTFGLEPLPGAPPVLTREAVGGLIDRTDFHESIPAELDHLFESITLRGLSAEVDPDALAIRNIGAVLGSSGPWSRGQFKIDDLTMGVVVLDPVGGGEMLFAFQATAEIFPSLFKGRFEVSISASGSGDLSVVAAFSGSVSLTDLVNQLAGTIVIPPDWSFAFTDFGMSIDKPAGGTAQYVLYGATQAVLLLPLLGVHAEVDLQVVVESASKSYRLVGGLPLGDSTFDVEIDLAQERKSVKGSWSTLGGHGLSIAQLASDAGLTAPAAPDGLDLALKSAALDYDVSDSVLVLEAESASYGKGVVVGLEATDWAFFAGIDVERRIDLAELPLVKNVLGGHATVAIDAIQVLAASAIDAAAAAKVNERIAAGYPTVPAGGMSGVALTMTFDAGGERSTLTVATPPGEPEAPPSADVRAVLSDPPPAPSDGTAWFDVQKSFGPIAFRKVGIRYRSGTLAILVDATLAGAGLTISMLGLGVRSPLSTFEPRFTLDGLGVALAAGPVELSGALAGTIDPVDLYGELLLRVKRLQVSALGAYREVDGHPSFFLYAVADYPIGGPAFFFVTGLAAGLGYNRRLLVPSVDGVATFPLVEWAAGQGDPPPTGRGVDVGSQVAKVIARLSSGGVVAPAAGEDWLAAGVRFTSFRLLDSFALATVVFGARFEVALLGLSTLRVPPAPQSPVAEAQLALQARYSPSTGLLAISGQLTPQSYVLSRDCHLTGGFAFYSWMGGEHEGEFVLTLGGYSPRFSAPDRYPRVPRLGMAWRVDDDLSVSGELYFALTSSAAMAGGRLEAVYQTKRVSASFTVHADFLLVFEPFHYYASAGVEVAAAFHWGLLKASGHVSVSVELWGPPFSGHVDVDLSIVSFTIGWGGSSRDTSATITWSEFVGRLLPKARPQSASPTVAQPAVVQIQVSSGLRVRVSDEDGALNWIVGADGLELVTESAIPSKTHKFGATVRLASDAPAPVTGFGVGPTGTSSASFQSEHELKVVSDRTAEFVATPLLRNVPKALWEHRRFDANGVPQGIDPLNSTTIDGVTVGYRVAPAPVPPGERLVIPLENLAYTLAEPTRAFAWSDATAPDDDAFKHETVWDTIEGARAVANRTDLVEAVVADGMVVPTQLDVSELASRAHYDLLEDPVLRLLGEQR